MRNGTQLALGFAEQHEPHDNRSGQGANELTRKIIRFIESQGWQAERIAVMGRPIERRNCAGHVVAVDWAKSNMTVGTADISATIKGRSVKIEVKVGADRQSIAQWKYQQSIERAGGLYYIARDFETFVDWYRVTQF